MTGAGNLVLIGMPGAGKSTVGALLARRLNIPFIDIDELMIARRGRPLQKIIDTEGLQAFARLEEETILALDAAASVIATGGSAVYSVAAMTALGRDGTIIFLDLPLQELEERISDMTTRGMVIAPETTFAELYRQRRPLYRRHADLVIVPGGRRPAELVIDIEDLLRRRGLTLGR
ncbi:shikimate kinase [Desulfuromonas soudanensis]|uniref:Shikimate kinase n=1 Tax=Desulfuromonas soudanensis TaxID=1603606 RepID=A0A0M4D532_9BACT|nr:shikimate kinase [Desulfuromonas soudanensis]ALC15797.1 shikimate kinase [Desulfuromonas soudanensis]